MIWQIELPARRTKSEILATFCPDQNVPAPSVHRSANEANKYENIQGVEQYYMTEKTWKWRGELKWIKTIVMWFRFHVTRFHVTN